ncbi:MAG: ammonia-forming cytochrome c nitrite reductase subunit c552 [Lachnospiraceae bacterium]|nr:ammonia-forming cytochrome c nitrite reductase subunit c552 [Lachnospiraceae bacterium]
MMEKKTIIKGVCFAAGFIAAAACLSGVVGGKDVRYRPMKPEGQELSRDDIEYLSVQAPEASSKDGTVNAADWESTYPYIVASMGANGDNSYAVDYLEQDPYLVNIYEGYGFAKDYMSARGHNYCLEDVAATARPHGQAKCLTCKTPNFTKMVQDLGVGVYQMDFEEVYAKMEENPSCYTCHGNNAGNGGKLEVTHTYVSKNLGENVSSIDSATLSCGQCHIEYFFYPGTDETTMPYSSVAEMTPTAILAYYDSIGFSDWTQESTGANLLKAQHPEMETYLQGKHASMLNCADCHMELVQEKDGTVYHSHTFESPLENENLLKVCVQCHGDKNMTTYVKSIQDEVTARETEVGNKLSDFKDSLAAAVAGGTKNEEELNKLRKIYREAQWYFDFCYVENSEGAHNSSLAKECLNTAEMKIREGMELLV